MTALTQNTVEPVAHPPLARVSAWTQLGLMLQWQLRRSAAFLPLMVVVQILIAVATVIGFGLVVGTPAPEQALYLATGAPTVTLVAIGLVLTPQMMVQAKTEGSLDWLRTLPMPREVFLFADLAMWTLIALPGTVLGVIAGAWRFDLALRPTWMVVPTVLLVALTAASIGYAVGTLLQPQIAHLISQVLLFLVMLFTPVSYPAANMPGWAQRVHEWLPLEPMAQAMRSALAPDSFSMAPRQWAVLLVWAAASVLGARWALRRRG